MPGGGLRRLWRRSPWIVGLVWGVGAVLLAADLLLAARRVGYAREITRLRAGMSSVERARIDAALKSDSNRVAVILELARRQARGDDGLHLAISLDSSVMHLEQSGAILRTIPVEIGRDRWERVGKRDSVLVTAPRGTRTVESVNGTLGAILSGGASLVAAVGADSTTLVAGAVRIAARDFSVLAPSLKPGVRVYFY